MTRAFLTILVTVAALAFTAPAMAQISVSRTPAANAPVLGAVIRGGTTSTFSVSTAGVVTRTSGDAIRLTGGSVTAPSFSVVCNLDILCNLRYIRITVQTTGASGPPTITKFRVSGLTGTTYRQGSAPAEASVLTFDLNPFILPAYANFTVGMDVQVPAGTASGVDTFTFSVTATQL